MIADRAGRIEHVPNAFYPVEAGGPAAAVEPGAVGVTQEQIYDGLDLDLSWSERDLPERERTKHVHRLHPYLGKFIPQLVEELLRRHVPPGGRVLDPFAGSGTTLVQALESGLDAVGVDIAAFNCLLMRVKTARYNPFVLERELRDALARFERGRGRRRRGRRRTSRAWFAPQARDELLRFRSLRRRLRARRRAARRARARRALGAADDALRPRLPAARRSSSRTGATSTGASAGPSSAPSTSSAATRSTRSRG